MNKKKTTADADKISVIIPTYNSGLFIRDVLQSVYSQTLPPQEIIVVDDGSNDNTIEIIKSETRCKNIKLIEQKHKGDPAFGRNIGVRKAEGDYIAFLDHDDLWPVDKLAIQHQRLSQNKSVDITVGKTQIFRFQSRSHNYRKQFHGKPKYNLLLSAALIRRELFEKVGIFDEEMDLWGSDGDWFIRAWEKGILYHFHDDVTLHWQYHENNTSRDKDERVRALAEVMKKSLDRRRNENDGIITNLPPLNLL